MTDVMDDIEDLELSDEERTLIGTLREKNVSAGAVNERIKTAMAATSQTKPAEEKPKEETVTVSQVKEMFDRYSQRNEAAQARTQIKTEIGKLVDASGIGSERVKTRLVNEVFSSLAGRKDLASLSDEDFDKALKDETTKAVEAEKAEILSAAEKMGAKPPEKREPEPEPEKETVVSRNTAAERMGERTGEEPPPRSAAQTAPRSVDRVNHKNLDDAFGDPDADWNLTDAQIEGETSREAERFLQRAGG